MPRLLPLLAAACLLTPAGAFAGEPFRLAPGEITTVKPLGAVAGTSGLKGIATRVLAGDPTKPGLYTIALTVPAHTTIQAHTHRDERSATVVSGEWWFGYGPVANPGALKRLPPGAFYTEAAGRPHFASTGERAAVVFITGFGPTDTVYAAAPLTPASLSQPGTPP